MLGMQAYVFSRTLRQADCPGVIISDKPAEILAALKATRGKDIWLFGGGSLFLSFLDLGSTRFIARPQFVGKSSGCRSDLTMVR